MVMAEKELYLCEAVVGEREGLQGPGRASWWLAGQGGGQALQLVVAQVQRLQGRQQRLREGGQRQHTYPMNQVGFNQTEHEEADREGGSEVGPLPAGRLAGSPPAQQAAP